MALPLTQMELRRVPAEDAPHVGEALREVSYCGSPYYGSSLMWQMELIRVPAEQAPHVDEALREVARRLLGRGTFTTT